MSPGRDSIQTVTWLGMILGPLPPTQGFPMSCFHLKGSERKAQGEFCFPFSPGAWDGTGVSHMQGKHSNTELHPQPIQGGFLSLFN
jgi:hypothetical protein